MKQEFTRSGSQQPALAGLMASLVLGAAQVAGAATVSFTGTYVQEFDGLNQSGAQTLTGKGPHPFSDLTALAISGMDGWYLANPGGSSSNTEYRAQDGSQSGSSGRGVVSFGLAGDSDRALGQLATSNQVNSFGVLLTNATGEALPGIIVSFTGEQWRAGGPGVINTLSFLWGLGSSIDDATTAVPALDFITPNLVGNESALNGNLPENQQQLRAAILFDWAPGTTLALRWNGEDVTGQDSGLAIDKLGITVVPVPAAAWLFGSALGLIGLLRRRILG
jgi:hypothetical protein